MNKRKNSGITLIAMVITIIVMLILAGVSINAAIGENGIITQAQEATIRQSEATLTEYLQQVYVDEETEDRVNGADLDTPLLKLKNVHRDWFYDPRLDETAIGGFDFIFYFDEGTNQFYNLYFIKKSGLPDNIKKNIRGGDATDSFGNVENYNTYSVLTDCYIVSDDLQVSYCDGKLTSFKNVDDQGGLRTMYDAGSSMAKLLSGDNTSSISAQDALSYTELEITDEDNITSLSDIYFLHSLTKLTLTDYTGDLKGIGNARKLTYIYINNKNNKTNIDYTGIEKASGLQQLYFLKPTDTEVEKLCTAMSNGNYPNLQTVGMYGTFSGWDGPEQNHIYQGSTKSNLTSISSFDKWSTTTKQAVRVLYVSNNKLTSLDGIQGFTNLYSLRADYNNLTTIAAIKDLVNLEYFRCGYNKDIDDLSVIDKFEKMKRTNCTGCTAVTSISTFVTDKTNMSALYAESLPNLTFPDTFWTQEKIQQLVKISDLRIDPQYSLVFSAAKKTLIISSTESADAIMSKLKNSTIIEDLNLTGNKNLTDEQIQELLVSLPNLKNVILDKTNVKSLDWANSQTNLRRVSFLDTEVTDITPLCKSIKTGTNKKDPATYYANGLGMIRFNGNSVVLYKADDADFNAQIVSLIHACYKSYARDYEAFGIPNGAGGGFCCINQSYFEEINKLTSLEYMGMCKYSWTVDIDLSNTKLKEIRFEFTSSSKITLPSTIVVIRTTYVPSIYIDSISNLTTITGNGCKLYANDYTTSTGVTYTTGGSGGTDPINIYATWGSWIKTFNITGAWAQAKYYSIDMNWLRPMTNCEKITLSGKELKNLDGSVFKNYTKKFSLTVNDMGLYKFNNLNLAANMDELWLNNNDFSNLADFVGNQNLRVISLENNALQNFTSYYDENGKPKTKLTSEILAEIPTLKQVYLSGNKEFTNDKALINAGFTKTTVKISNVVHEVYQRD